MGVWYENIDWNAVETAIREFYGKVCGIVLDYEQEYPEVVITGTLSNYPPRIELNCFHEATNKKRSQEIFPVNGKDVYRNLEDEERIKFSDLATSISKVGAEKMKIRTEHFPSNTHYTIKANYKEGFLLPYDDGISENGLYKENEAPF